MGTCRVEKRVEYLHETAHATYHMHTHIQPVPCVLAFWRFGVLRLLVALRFVRFGVLRPTAGVQAAFCAFCAFWTWGHS